MAALTSDAAPHGGLGATRVRSAPFAQLIGLLVAVLAGAYVLLNGSDWAFDDNIYLVLARQHGFTVQWLTDPVFGHFALGYRFGYSALVHLMPIDYRWVVVVMLLLLGAAAVTFFRVVELLFQRRWLAVSLTMWFAGSILFVRAIQWWAFGLQGIPTVLGDLLCLYAYLRYEREPRQRWIALSAGSLAFGLLFYEKAAFALLYIAMLRLLFLAPELSRRTIVDIARRERWIWLAYLVVLAVWFAGYRYSGADLGSATSPTAAQWLRFFEVGWLQSVVPAAYGVGMPWANIYTSTALSSLQVVEIVVLQLTTVLIVVVSIVRHRSAWRAWACLVFIFVLTGFLSGQTRIGLYSASAIAGDLRYWIDFAWLTPLLVCLAFLPAPGRGAAPVPACPRGTPGRSLVPAAAAVLLLAFGFASATTTHHMEALWPGVQARAWETNLARTLPAAQRRWPAAVIAQGVVPFYIVEPAVAPINQLSVVLPHYGGRLRMDGPVRGPILLIEPSGATIRATPRVVLHRSLSGCSGRGGPRTFALGLTPQATPPGSAYLRVRYRSLHDEMLPITVNAGIGLDASADHAALLAPDAHETIAWLGPEPFTRLRLSASVGPGTCLADLDVVTLTPSP